MMLEIIRSTAHQMWALLLVLLSVLAAFQSQQKWIRVFGVVAALAFAGLFLFLAVSSGIAISHKHQVIDELTKLRHAGRKRYTEWWTFCQDPEKSEIARKESEEIRLKVIAILKRKVSVAEVDYFNIPKAVEPFPDTTVKLCPQAVLINEWGHRLERLGEIIQRFTAR